MDTQLGALVLLPRTPPAQQLNLQVVEWIQISETMGD
jgi:hypothetical protein